MRYAAILLALLLPGCSAEPDFDTELAVRDAQIAELTEANADLERRLNKLEKTSAVLSHTAISQLERQAQAPVQAQSLPDFDRDRIESRVTDLERDAGKMPRP